MTVKFRGDSGAEIASFLREKNIPRSNFQRVTIFFEGRLSLFGTGILINHQVDGATLKEVYY